MQPMASLRKKFLHRLFKLSLLLKALNGAWETVSGFLFLFASKATVTGWLSLLTRNELLEDPHDQFIAFLGHALQNLAADARIFAGVYILTHGLLNIFLTIQLYRDKHWAYLVTIGVTLVLMTYQVYRISIHHSLFLTAVTVFDILFVMLAWHEYKNHRERSELKKSIATAV